VNKSLRHEEAGRVPIGDLDYMVTTSNMDPHIKLYS
jgi:hypothetical protein